MATKDPEQRSLGADARAATLNLGDTKSRIRRRVLQETLEKCMFLLHWAGQHPTVTCDTTWDQLMQKAVNSILSLEITTQALERFKLSDPDLEGMDARPKTWVDLAVLQVVGGQDLMAKRLLEALEFHRSVSDQAAAHLNLLVDKHLQGILVGRTITSPETRSWTEMPHHPW